MTTKSPGQTDIPRLLDDLLAEAFAQRASDLHVEPTAAGCELRLRVDGVLHELRTLDHNVGRGLVNRLMVLASLLTYRTDVPQEGRFGTRDASGQAVEVRLAVMPVIHGLRAVIRLPADLMSPRSLDQLMLPDAVVRALEDFARRDAGMLLLTGPAGSGKTTTIHALLQRIATHGEGLSIIAMEDPVERDLPGVTQIQIQPFGELTYERALRSVLRQDPQVLMLGEIRDAQTASLAVQATLTGHRLISTLHAGSPESALTRLLEMGVEPYQVVSAVHAVVSQRLVRKRCEAGGYRGRLPVAELALMNEALRQATLERRDATALRQAIVATPGFTSMAEAARDLIARGLTDVDEARRVLGADFTLG